MSTESDSNDNDLNSGVGKGDVTKDVTSRKRVYSQANLNVAIARSDSEESLCSEMDADSKDIFTKVNYYSDVEEIKVVWLETLEKSETAGTALLLAFLIQSTGCPSVLLEESDYLNITSMEKFEEATRDKRLSNYKLQLNRIVEFITHTFNEEILRRKFLMKKFVSFVLLMGDSCLKYFRMVAVYAGTAVMSLLLKLEVELEPGMSVLETRLSSDRLSTDSNISNERICELKKAEKLSNSTDHFSVLFEKLCHQRHRDVETDIRLHVITTLTRWLTDYPQKFVNDNYLRYFVWMFCDSSAKVRFRAIKGCMELFGDKRNKSKLQTFVLKSKPFIMKMTDDVSSRVAEAALMCIYFIYRNYSILTSEECEKIYFKVYSTKAKIAETAGAFVLHKISEGAESQMAMLNDLARFHFESGVTGNEDYFVSALINNAPFLMKWKLWTTTILFTTDVSLQPILCRMLISTIRLISNKDEYVIKKMNMFPLFSQEKYMALKKRLRADQFPEVNLQKMTVHFTHMLPELIQHFKFNNLCLAALMQIPQHFNYSYTGELKHTVGLLCQDFITSRNGLKDMYCCCSIITIMESSQDCEVINTCRRFVQLFCERQFKHAIMTILDNKVDIEDRDQVLRVQLSLQKTRILATFYDLYSTPVSSLAFQGLQALSDIQEPVSDELSLMLTLLNNICGRIIFTRVDKMFSKVENDESVHDEDMKSINRYIFAYVGSLMVLLKKMRCTEVVEMAFIASCNVLLASSKYNVKLLSLRGLVIVPSDTCMELVSAALHSLIPFPEHNQDSVKLNKQQNLLKMFCTLVKSGTFKIIYLCNILAYLENEGLKEIAGETLCTLFRKNPEDTSKVIINYLSFLFSVSQEQGTDNVHSAEIIANALSAGFKKKEEVAFTLHIAAFSYIKIHNCLKFLKIIVGFAALLSKRILPHVRKLIELFFGCTVPVEVYDYLDSIHHVLGIID